MSCTSAGPTSISPSTLPAPSSRTKTACSPSSPISMSYAGIMRSGAAGSSSGSANTTPEPRPRRSSNASSPEATVAETRDVFIVCNNVEELGGLQRWARHIAHLFTDRGHRVHLIGITHADRPHDYGANPPYRVTV